MNFNLSPRYRTGSGSDRTQLGERLPFDVKSRHRRVRVYRLLKTQDLGTSEMPALDHPIVHTVAYHIHTGGHAITAFDWDQFRAFADSHLVRRLPKSGHEGG
jgi:hypothetical protein